MRRFAFLVVLAGVLAVPVAVDAPRERGFYLAPHQARDTVSQARSGGRAASPTDQIDVSRLATPQAETAVAVDPADANVLLGASGSFDATIAVFGSSDGGATWTSSGLRPRGLCSFGDPAPAIDDAHRQFLAFLAAPCFQERGRIRVALATRPSSAAAWTTRVPAIPGKSTFDDKEALAVDASPASPHHGRLYLAFSRLATKNGDLHVVLTHSDDGGTTWSPPVRVSGGAHVDETYPSVAVGAGGTVLVSWLTLDQRVFLDRSTDGGDHFGKDVLVTVAAQLPSGFCHFGGTALPAQPKRCVAAAPLVTADATAARVYVTYGAAGSSGREQNVYVSSYDALSLAPLVAQRQINPPDGAVTSDQFFPASAVDPSTGRLWACWYDTAGDRTRRRTRYTCSASSDGGATWAPPVRAAAVFSDETVRAATAFEYGDYAGLAVANGIAHPMWTDSRNLAKLGEEIYTTALQLP